MYRREGDRLFVFGSKGGAHSHPDWYHNVVAHPDVVVEIGAEVLPMTAVDVTGDERDEIYARQSAEWTFFGDYQAGTDRTIPVVELVAR